MNNSTLIESIGQVAVSTLRMTPSCSNAADAGCDAAGSIADPGAFTLSPTGTGRVGTGCAGQSFTITTNSAATGEATFAPAGGGPLLLEQPLLSSDQNKCVIDFTFSVNRLPNHDASAAAPGIQSAQVAIVEGTHLILSSPAQATGADFTTVTPPPSRRVVPADFNGNGSTDVSVWRPSTGQWFVKDQFVRSWGLSSDIPVTGDYNASGTSDVAVYRPSTGQWFVADQSTTSWGLPGDVPVPGDYDGNGSTDIAVWRPSTGQWFVLGQPGVSWGLSDDLPIPGDYDGNGSTDVAVWRPSTGQWFVRNQTTHSWGFSSDIPVPGDYDGNGSTDIAVWRPSTGQWFVKDIKTVSWGLSGDIPLPGDYDGNGTTDLAVFRNGQWLFTAGATTVYFGLPDDVPAPLPVPIYLKYFKK